MTRQPGFLPMSVREGERLGIREFDIILVTGDAYVDHPSFGTALIGRVLWDAGYSVGIIAQPDWKSDTDFAALKKPRLFFGISSGNVDSLVNNLTPNLKRRSEDVYSPGGVQKRPDRATIVYTNRVHEIYPDTPIVIGGIEASLRRFAHYDYWQDRVRQAILADAPADLLVFGMGERQMVEIARRLDAGVPARAIRDVPGTAFAMPLSEWRDQPREGTVEIPGFTEVSQDRNAYARAFMLHYREQDPV
ncbi:MAG: YgiQ family radical SAM protein, partial [Methanoregula sp.]|nr:YgiQ family radical SAM protein [Methanoregula sp.]